MTKIPFATRTKLFMAAVVILVSVGVLIQRVNRPRTPKLPDPPLKELAAKRNIQLGNFAILNHLNEKPYTDILTSQFEFALADNAPNWYFTDGGLRPTRTTYNFKQMDEVISFAQRNGMPVQAHHYLWGEEKWLPEWLKEGNFSKAELYQIMQDHIMTVGAHYKGQIREWTVVNEVFTRNEHLFGLSDWWTDNTGGIEYIDQAFRWARQADPNAKLILNDFYNESINTTSNAMYEYAKGAIARGVPIDGIGMQMHIDGTHPPMKEEVKANMNRFSDLGLGIYVTEFDVNMNDLKTDASGKDQVAGGIYYEMLRACIEANNCHSFAYLGITDAETWYAHLGLKDPRPLMFDKKFQPKQAYYSTRSALEQP